MVVQALLAELLSLAPDFTVVSGDLTQRARRSEFAAAAAFLAELPGKALVVPGNHDIPLWRIDRRFRSALDSYRQQISQELNPLLVGPGLEILGLNTARSNVWKGGRISSEQTTLISEQFTDKGSGALKLLVTHHPFVSPPSDPGASIVGGGERALEAAQATGVDLLLAGHRHESHAVGSRERHPYIERSMLAVLAGTACSTRRRGEANSFNLIRGTSDELELEVWELRDTTFEIGFSQQFVRSTDGWSAA